MKIPSYDDIRAAHERIKPFINHTPVMKSESINNMFGSEIFFKCENFQKVGAFKYRGATNAINLLTDEELAKGVATHSSGNHAQALSLAARVKGISAYIVMPENSPKVKINAVKGYGAEIVFCEPTLAARESNLEKVIERTSATFVHPYDNYNIISGQGTAAKELIEEYGEFDFIFCPVGGGGLLSGTSISTKAMLPNAKVIATEPMGADDAYRSFYGDKLVPSIEPNTIADGLLTSLSDLTYEIIKKNVDEVVTVSEENIIKAMRLIWERMKIIIEPSSATVLAALMEEKEKFKGKRIGMIISGGNVDLDKLPWQETK
jgi:threonine dehydratase